MSKSKIWLLVLVVLMLTAPVTVSIWAGQSADKSGITIRQVKAQTVLYTIYRGDYREVGQAIGRLYALAIQKKIWPSGAIHFAYLNNPEHVSSVHWLTEIRIPVKEETLKLSGTLGEMTDIKKLPAMTMAVATKPAGLPDSASVYVRLDAWIFKQGYIADGGPCEKFLTNAKTGDYAQMKSEIMVPVTRISATD
ncbi:GyrI-like domain-containing protein [Planctomycetota bacterium]